MALSLEWEVVPDDLDLDLMWEGSPESRAQAAAVIRARCVRCGGIFRPGDRYVVPKELAGWGHALFAHLHCIDPLHPAFGRNRPRILRT